MASPAVTAIIMTADIPGHSRNIPGKIGKALIISVNTGISITLITLTVMADYIVPPLLIPAGMIREIISVA
jgi:hypothetical protein